MVQLKPVETFKGDKMKIEYSAALSPQKALSWLYIGLEVENVCCIDVEEINQNFGS